jgi:hypothetical protein
MAKSPIAAILLFSIATWAEMALAPMLAMGVGHVHPPVEITDSNAHPSGHHHVMPAGLPCCPKIGEKTEDPSLVEFAAGSLPCQEEHRCCFRQRPQSVPAPVSTGNGSTQELACAEADELNSVVAESHISLPAISALGSPPSVFGMTLRV